MQMRSSWRVYCYSPMLASTAGQGQRQPSLISFSKRHGFCFQNYEAESNCYAVEDYRPLGLDTISPNHLFSHSSQTKTLAERGTMTFSCGTDLGLESRALNRQVSPSPDILQSHNNVRVQYQNHLSQDKNWWGKKILLAQSHQLMKWKDPGPCSCPSPAAFDHTMLMPCDQQSQEV